jgi:hypothetical protein
MKPNDFGKILAEHCEKLAIKDFLALTREKMKIAILKLEVKASGYVLELEVTQLHGGGKRFWFKCPSCNKRRAILYQHPISSALGCRDCLNLDYRKRRYKGMIEASILKF